MRKFYIHTLNEIDIEYVLLFDYQNLHMINKRTSLPYFGVKLSCLLIEKNSLQLP